MDSAKTVPAVALVVPVLGTGWPGGQVLDLACGLARANVRVLVLAEDGRLVHELRRRGVTVQLGRLPRRALLDRRRLRATRSILLRHAGEDPLVIHGHGADAARPAALLARKLDAELFLSLYDRDDARATPPLGHANLATVFVHSLPCQEELVNHRGVPRERVRLVNPGLDLGRLARELGPPLPATDLGTESPVRGESPSARAPVIGALGRLEPLGGHDALLRAAKELLGRGLDFRLLLVGEGPEKRHLLALARELGIQESTIFAGDLPGRAEFFDAIDVFVAPALRDGFGHDLLEAMARALPVVATAAGSVFEQIEDEKTGLLAPPQDVPALAAAIARLLGDRAAARAMGERAREAVGTSFSIERLVDEVLPEYERAVAARETA
jgi:glycosyltransferase involved in cell wall biosynthesis